MRQVLTLWMPGTTFIVAIAMSMGLAGPLQAGYDGWYGPHRSYGGYGARYGHHDWHSGRHHDWHSGQHVGRHKGAHWDPWYGYHYGRHYGPHAGRHHDRHRGSHHDWHDD